jgi:hypothetical protein
MGVTITLGVAAPERLDLAFAFEDAERDLSLLGPKQAYEEGSVPAPLLPSVVRPFYCSCRNKT